MTKVKLKYSTNSKYYTTTNISYRMTRLTKLPKLGDDIYFILNLVCLKYTGKFLPADCSTTTKWKWAWRGWDGGEGFRHEHGIVGQKIAIQPKLIPCEVMFYDSSNDITQQIKRKLIVDELNLGLSYIHRWERLNQKYITEIQSDVIQLEFLQPPVEVARDDDVDAWQHQVTPHGQKMKEKEWEDWTQKLCIQSVMENKPITDSIRAFLFEWKKTLEVGQKTNELLNKLSPVFRFIQDTNTYSQATDLLASSGESLWHTRLPLLGNSYQATRQFFHDNPPSELQVWDFKPSRTRGSFSRRLDRIMKENATQGSGEIKLNKNACEAYLNAWISSLPYDSYQHQRRMGWGWGDWRSPSYRKTTGWLKSMMKLYPPLTLEDQLRIAGVRPDRDIHSKMVKVWC